MADNNLADDSPAQPNKPAQTDSHRLSNSGPEGAAAEEATETGTKTGAEPAPTPTPPAEPFGSAELHGVIQQPSRVIDIVLAERDRLMATVRVGTAVTVLGAVLLTCSILAALPFGIVIGFSRSVDVAVLFLGSALICFPSLQVFGAYRGVCLSTAQNLTLALVIPAAAALFTLGFFPIYWFLDLTMPTDSVITGTFVRVVLLVVALVLAMSHCNRCLFRNAALGLSRADRTLWIGWQALLVFITFRMALTLGLFE